MLDQLDLPRAIPFLQLLLSLDCVFDVRELLVVDQSMDLILLGEAGHGVGAMLVGAADEIVGDADVERAAEPTGGDVDPENSLSAHRRFPGVLDCPLSRAMTPYLLLPQLCGAFEARNHRDAQEIVARPRGI